MGGTRRTSRAIAGVAAPGLHASWQRPARSVVLGVPHDVSGMEAGGGIYHPVSVRPRLRSGGDPASIEAALKLIANAQRPYLYAGAGVLVSEATDALLEFAELLTLPVCNDAQRKKRVSEDHPLSLGIGGSSCRRAIIRYQRWRWRGEPTSLSRLAAASNTRQAL